MAKYSVTLRVQDYHVALLAAIRHEYVIACALLDERHNDPLGRLEDQRFYTFGRIHQHNVVIARLPEGTVGIDASAAAAADLANSFPLLRFGLMVGIAGGAPTRKNDVRLGDVVVSVPGDKERSGGVVQYDFGASIQNKGTILRRWHNRPPLILLNAVGELQAQYESEGHTLEEAVLQLISNNKKGRLNAYKKPDAHQDILFVSDFVHEDETLSCNELGCIWRNDKIIERKERGASSDQIVIHLGTVGSGNLLMRDAVLRDRIANEDGVRCFEMESAGLMNSRFPWLIIRGISDYADSHKHDGWQNYAAAVAAIYTKALLEIVPPVANANVSQPINGEADHVFGSSDLFELLAYDQMNSKRDYAMPENSYNLEWIWDTAFAKWLCHTSSDKPFWVCGKPGSGKSTLMAYLSHSNQTRNMLRAADIGFEVLYFFYDYRAGDSLANDIEGMLRMLLYQLAKKIRPVRNHLKQALKTQQQESPSKKFLLDMVCDVLSMEDFRTCIFVDGLDEYEGSYVELVQTCRSIIRRTGAKMCIASRPEVPIKEILQIYAEIYMQDHNRSSMDSYATETILTASLKDNDIKQAMSQTLVERLVEKAEGIILWFKLAFDEAMATCLAGSRDFDVERFLEEIPQGLDAMYRRILGLLPQVHLHECALLLFMVQEFSGMEGHIRPSASSFLEHLLGAYDFLANENQMYFKSKTISSIAEFHGHIKPLLRGLVEFEAVGELTKTFDMRLIHKTFATFLKKSSWLEDNLSPEFKRSYPNAFVLRIYASILKRAGSENLISNDQRKACFKEIQRFKRLRNDFTKVHYLKLGYAAMRSIPIINGHRSPTMGFIAEITGLDRRLQLVMQGNGTAAKMFLWSAAQVFTISSSNHTFPPTWQIRRNILENSCISFLTIALGCEKGGGAVHEIIGSALQTNFDLMMALNIPHERLVFRLQWLGSIDKPTQDHLYLFILLHSGLMDSFLQHLAGCNPTLSLREKMLTSLVHRCSSTNSIFTEERLPRLFDGIISREEVVKTHHVCYLLSNNTCVDAAARTAGCLLPFLNKMRDNHAESQVICSCETHGSHCSLLLHWARRASSCRAFQGKWILSHEHKQTELNYYGELLSLVVAYGLDINKPCYAGGTVLHAMLHDSQIKKHAQYSSIGDDLEMTRQKFAALVSHGIDPTIKGKGGTALQIAQRSRAKLLKTYKQRDHQLKIEEVMGSITNWLREYEREGSWQADTLAEIAKWSFSVPRPEELCESGGCAKPKPG